MGFNKRRMESERAAAAAKEFEARRALGPQLLADAEYAELMATIICVAHGPDESAPGAQKRDN